MRSSSVKFGTALALITVLVAACSTNPSSGKTTKAGGVTLTFTATADLKSAIQPVLDSWAKTHPDIKINTSFVKDPASLERTQLQGGHAADILSVWPGNGNPASMEQLVSGKFLADLSDQPWVSKVPEGNRKFVSSDGKVYFFAPFAVAIGAFYNKDVFTKNNLTVPTTFEQVLSYCDKLNAAGVVPFALGNQEGGVPLLISYALVPSLVYAKNPNFDKDLKDGKATFANSAWKETLTKYKMMADRKCFNKNFNGTTYDDQAKMIATGKAAMAVLGSPSVTQLEQYGTPGNYAMFPLPATNAASDVWGAVGLGSGFGVNANGSNVAAAKQFIAYVAQDANDAAIAAKIGGMPTIPSSSTADPVTALFAPLIRAGKTAAFPDQFWPNPKVSTAHTAGVQQLLVGKETVDQVLADMDKAYKG